MLFLIENRAILLRMIRIEKLAKISRRTKVSLWPQNSSQNLSDAPVKQTTEQKFANTKLSRDYPKHGRLGDMKAAITLRHKRASELPKRAIVTESSHVLNRDKVIDPRYPANEMPLWRIEQTVNSVNDRTPFEVDQLNLDDQSADSVDSYRFEDFEYMPPEYMLGRDDELGYLPKEFEWPEETKSYFKDEDKKNKKYQWEFYKQNEVEDEYMGVRRGKTRHLHATGAPIDTRYFDPNVLRIGEKWKPQELFTEEISKKIKEQEMKEKYIPGYKDKQNLQRQAFPEHHRDYQVIPAFTLPKLSERKNHPEGIASFSGALNITKTKLVSENKRVEIMEDIQQQEEVLVAGAKKIIQNGKLLQIDGGDYGVNPPTNIWNPLDTKFGSIDKTNMFGSHADERSLVEETWLWDERHGLPKPERYSKAIASNLTKLLKSINNKNTASLPDEKVHLIYPKRVNGSICYLEVHDDLVSSNFASTPVENSKIVTSSADEDTNDEFEIYSPTQLMVENHFYNLKKINEKNNRNGEVKKDLVSGEKTFLNSIVISDFSTPSFDTSEHNISRFGKDRESKRKFLPILRDEMTDEESKGRLTMILHGLLHDQAVREFGVHEKLETPLSAYGFSITDGKTAHVIKFQLNTTNLVDDHDIFNQVESFERLELYEDASHFLWDEPERIKSFNSENLLKLATLLNSN